MLSCLSACGTVYRDQGNTIFRGGEIMRCWSLLQHTSCLSVSSLDSCILIHVELGNPSSLLPPYCFCKLLVLYLYMLLKSPQMLTWKLRHLKRELMLPWLIEFWRKSSGLIESWCSSNLLPGLMFNTTKNNHHQIQQIKFWRDSSSPYSVPRICNCHLDLIVGGMSLLRGRDVSWERKRKIWPSLKGGLVKSINIGTNLLYQAAHFCLVNCM